MDKSGYQTVDANTSVTEALEAFVIGLYSDAFNAVVSLINRYLRKSLSICEMLKDFVKGLCTDTSSAAK